MENIKLIQKKFKYLSKNSKKNYNELVSYFHEKKLLEIKYNLDELAYLNFLKSCLQISQSNYFHLKSIKDKFLYECMKKALNVNETEFLTTLTLLVN